jgi:hypothetical protein
MMFGDALRPTELGGGLACWALPSPAPVVGDDLDCWVATSRGGHGRGCFPEFVGGVVGWLSLWERLVFLKSTLKAYYIFTSN